MTPQKCLLPAHAMAAILVGLAPSASPAINIIIGFDTLPSSQGWVYEAVGVHSGEAEASNFSISGGTLTLDTIGSNSSGSGHAIYAQFGILNSTNPLVIEWTSRTTQTEGAGNFGFAVSAATGAEQYLAGFRTDRVVFENLSFFEWDTTSFHSYRIETTPGSTTFDFFINDIKVASPTTTNRPLNRLAFGDGTGSANAHAEITAFSFTQVPEPSSTSLFLAGLAAFCLRNRR